MLTVQNSMFDRSPRPAWAGPVTTQTTRHTGHRGTPANHVEVSGIVLPTAVPNRRKTTGTHPHTGGVGLGLPDLSKTFLRHPGLSQQWGRIEKTVGDAAANLMEWNAHRQPREMHDENVPHGVLHMRMSTVIPQKPEDDMNPNEYSIEGEVQRGFAIYDPGGRKVRMQTVGSPARFRVSNSTATFSRDPRHL